jgi:hypothetical protein
MIPTVGSARGRPRFLDVSFSGSLTAEAFLHLRQY